MDSYILQNIYKMRAMKSLLFSLTWLHVSLGSLTFLPTIVDKYTAGENESFRPEFMEVVTSNNDNPYTPPILQTYIRHSVSNVYIPVYSKNGLRIRLKDSVIVECYDYDNHQCDNYTLSSVEIEQLSLYASMVESVGGSMNMDYSIGVIRDKDKPYTQGMYTQLGNFITFWIRLKDNANRYVYNTGDTTITALSILELAAHERAHFDSIITYNDNSGHCDTYQRTYNTLMNNAIRDIHKYVDLTTQVMSNAEIKSASAQFGTDLARVVGIIVGSWVFFRVMYAYVLT